MSVTSLTWLDPCSVTSHQYYLFSSPFCRKKKKKKSKDREREREEILEASSAAAGSSSGASTSSSSRPKEVDEYLRGKTKAEIAFLKRKEQLVCGNLTLGPFETRYRVRSFFQDADRIKAKATVSHKEKVEKFNEYLNNLSEHYEQAKVSWTK